MSNRIDEAINKALEKEPEYELPHGFADRVMAAIQRKAAEKEAKRDRWWLVTGLIGMVAAFMYAVAAVQFKPGVGVFTFFSGYWGLILFGVLFVTALNVVDKRLLKHHK
ncbi:MAG TPA: hypothetical protein VFE50_00340 [Cyclobacteriaceae bacterium]|nr:hypothetical protein [Cyclobacteriaceae bacterium]